MSLGHTGGSVEATAIIDIPGVFTSEEGVVGLKAVLQDYSFTREHSFNLLSMSRLLHTQEWKMTHGASHSSVLRTGRAESSILILLFQQQKGQYMHADLYKWLR